MSKSFDPHRVLDAADALQRKIIEKRNAMMQNIAKTRWMLARDHHLTEEGQLMDFERWPFQKEIFLSASSKIVVCGAAGWGKSAFVLCDDLAKSIWGMRVFHVFDGDKKRDKVVQGVIDPVLGQVHFYAEMLNVAKDRNATVDSAGFKHFGKGSINFVGANTTKAFTTYRADAVAVDEHQDCDSRNLRELFSRMIGSDYGYVVYVGNPRTPGNDENQNLDWEFQQSNQKEWQVPCPHCLQHQALGWWTHFVEEVRNNYGAILSVRVRDQQRAARTDLDFRPICTNCGLPMNRLANGQWRALAPEKQFDGFRLSCLPNPTVSMWSLYDHYRRALADPDAMQKFVNNQLGLTYAAAGQAITEEMLSAAATRRVGTIEPYRLIPVEHVRWRV